MLLDFEPCLIKLKLKKTYPVGYLLCICLYCCHKVPDELQLFLTDKQPWDMEMEIEITINIPVLSIILSPDPKIWPMKRMKYM